MLASMPNANYDHDVTQLTRRNLEILLRLGVIFALLFFTIRIILPFSGPLAWGAILAVALYPLFTRICKRFGDKRKRVGIAFIVLSIGLIMVPSFILATESLHSMQHIKEKWDAGELTVPPPSEKVKEWPVIGERMHSFWSDISKDLEETARKFMPRLKAVAKDALSMLGGVVKQLLGLTFSLILTGVFLICGEKCSGFFRQLSNRLNGPKGDQYVTLITKTIRSVAVGVVGTALIQAIAAAIGLWLIGMPLVALWTLLVLMCAIIQLPPILVLGPIAAYIFSSHDPIPATIFLIWSILVSVSDGFLKPILLGRGVDIPMLVILIGAIGGMIVAGIMGLFLGAVTLAVTYKLFIAWLHPEEGLMEVQGKASEAS